MAVDLRSDTISMPDQAMLESILGAKLGDDGRADSRGRGEDETANQLEDMAARLLGKEEGVLFPSGTMGNTAAILSFCQPGGRVLVDEMQHIYLSEKTVFDPSLGQLIPVTYRLDEDFLPDPEDMRRILKQEKISLICVENTHNFSGGTCIPQKRLSQIRALADEYRIPVHMDGARIFNAAAALGVSAKSVASQADTVMFCLSKGRGAPIGSLVCGTHEACGKIRKKRKLLGGAMRQAGVIAAPGIYALEHNRERLMEDHENTAFAAGRLLGLKHTKIWGNTSTNMIVLDVSGLGLSPEDYCKEAAARGLLIKPILQGKVRLVFYKDISREDTQKAVDIIHQMDEELAGKMTP